jgi:hypothetical protein
MRYWLMKSEPDEFSPLEQGGQRKGWDPSFPNLAPLYIPRVSSSGS